MRGRILSLAISIVSLVISIGSFLSAAKSARSAKDSHSRLLEANANALGPSIYFDKEVKVDSGRYFVHIENSLDPQRDSTDYSKGFIERHLVEPLTSFSTPGDDSQKIFVFFQATFRNQGSRSTSIHAESSYVGIVETLRTQLCENNEFVVAPSQKKSVAFYVGMTVKEWFELSTSNAQNVRTFKITASIEPEASSQVWEVKVTTEFFGSDQFNIGTARSVRSELPTVTIQELKRIFPAKSGKRSLRKSSRIEL